MINKCWCYRAGGFCIKTGSGMMLLLEEKVHRCLSYKTREKCDIFFTFKTQSKTNSSKEGQSGLGLT